MGDYEYSERDIQVYENTVADLERQLAEAKTQVKKAYDSAEHEFEQSKMWEARSVGLEGDNRRLNATIARLREDKARLDWLEEKGSPYWYLEVRPDDLYLEDDAAPEFGMPTLREAIDAACARGWG